MANISQNWLDKIGCNGLKILGFFCNDYSIKSHGNDISKKIKIPQRTVSRKLDDLCKIGILEFERIGKNKVYFLNFHCPIILEVISLIEAHKGTEFGLNHPKIKMILDEINCDKIIFGSYSSQRNKKSSDLDVVLFCKENKDIEKILESSPSEIHPQFTTISDFKKKLESKDALSLEIKKNHIILGDYSKIIKIFGAGVL